MCDFVLFLYCQSAVKVDVSDVSVVSDYKVLVVSHDSTTQDVIHSLLRKLHMKEYDSQTFVIQAELFSQTGQLVHLTQLT